MEITSGLFDKIVLQRNGDNLSNAFFEGICEKDGDITATISSQLLPVITIHKVAKAENGYFAGRLQGIPCGGPYRISLELSGNKNESVVIKDVLVGDVWILAGQSNMHGRGKLEYCEQPVDAVRAFYMDDRWDVASDPIHNMDKAVDVIHKNLMNGELPPQDTRYGVGPGVAFGKEMLRLTGVPQGIIACAHGGTSMSHWEPKLIDQGSSSLLGATLRRLRKNGSKVAGILWYQGENEAVGDVNFNYTKDMHILIAEFRRFCDDPKLPFVLMQLARVAEHAYPNDPCFWNNIQIRQLALQNDLSQVAVVPTIDLGLVDIIHLDAPSQNITGVRCAQAMYALQYGETETEKMPIMPGDIKFNCVDDVVLCVEIQFDNVVGNLSSQGRASGFTFSDGIDIVKTTLRGNTVVLQTAADNLDKLKQVKLNYGQGFSPYCNITDDAGRSLPVFSIPLGTVAFTPFCSCFSIELIEKSFSSIEKECPNGSDQNILCGFSTSFCDSRNLFEEWPKNEFCLLYSTNFTCDEEMPLKIFLGYDGPITLWYDEDFIAKDATGTNQAACDDASFKINAAKGNHSLKILLGNNTGKAYGIYLRLMLEDIKQEDVLKGEFISLPQWGACNIS